MNQPPVVLTTARLIAEPLVPEHHDAILEMHQDPRAMEGLGGIRDAVATQAYIQFNVAHWQRHGFGLWVLRLRDDGDIVGRLVLRHLDLDGVDEVELGYALKPPYWGRGLAMEASTRACDYAATELRLASLVAQIRPTNLPSIRLAERLGFTFEREITHAGTPHALFRRRFG